MDRPAGHWELELQNSRPELESSEPPKLLSISHSILTVRTVLYIVQNMIQLSVETWRVHNDVKYYVIPCSTCGC